MINIISIGKGSAVSERLIEKYPWLEERLLCFGDDKTELDKCHGERLLLDVMACPKDKQAQNAANEKIGAALEKFDKGDCQMAIACIELGQDSLLYTTVLASAHLRYQTLIVLCAEPSQGLSVVRTKEETTFIKRFLSDILFVQCTEQLWKDDCDLALEYRPMLCAFEYVVTKFTSSVPQLYAQEFKRNHPCRELKRYIKKGWITSNVSLWAISLLSFIRSFIKADKHD